MSTENQITKKDVAIALIENVMDENPKVEVKTDHLVNYETPDKIVLKDSSKSFMPDVTIAREDSQNFYQIELNNHFEVDKWQTMAKMAQHQNGNFYLILPENLKEIAKENLKKQNVNGHILYFNL